MKPVDFTKLSVVKGNKIYYLKPSFKHSKPGIYVSTQDVVDATGRSIRTVQAWCHNNNIVATKIYDIDRGTFSWRIRTYR